MRTGKYNSRGVVWRGEGGDQERALAGTYAGWADALAISHPFVSARLLRELANSYLDEAIREDSRAGAERRLS